jgi:DNA-binding response OmpR family regulator
MRVLVVEDEPYMAEAIRDGLRLEAIAADIAGDGDSALELLSIKMCRVLSWGLARSPGAPSRAWRGRPPVPLCCQVVSMLMA